MSNCVYPTCMMGGGGCDRENDCMAEERRERETTSKHVCPGGDYCVECLRYSLSTAQAEIEDLKKCHRSKEDVALINDLTQRLTEAQAEIERLKALVCNRCNGTREADTGGVTPWGAPINGECPECWSIDQLKKQLQISEAKRAELWDTVLFVSLRTNFFDATDEQLMHVVELEAKYTEENVKRLDARIQLRLRKALTSQDKPKILDVVEAAEVVIEHSKYPGDEFFSTLPPLARALDAWRGKEN